MAYRYQPTRNSKDIKKASLAFIEQNPHASASALMAHLTSTLDNIEEAMYQSEVEKDKIKAWGRAISKQLKEEYEFTQSAYTSYSCWEWSMGDYKFCVYYVPSKDNNYKIHFWQPWGGDNPHKGSVDTLEELFTQINPELKKVA